MADDGLSSEEAAAIASRHGLSLSDAVALRSLADTAEEADQLASDFAGSEDPRKLANELKGR